MEKQETKLIRAYTSQLFKKHVEYLKTQLSGVKFDDEIEFIHQTRVSSRRLRNILQVFSVYTGKKNVKKWLPAIRNLTKSLTNVRDLDVQIIFLEKLLTKDVKNEYRQGITRLLLRKIQKREKSQSHIFNSIKIFEKTETLREIQNFIKTYYIPLNEFEPPNDLFQLALTAIDNQIKHCFSFVPFITDPKNVEDLHNMRIAIKNLRYTTELFLDINPELSTYIDTLKTFQDYLGNIHDCDVWLEDLNSFSIKEESRVLKFYGKSYPFNLIKPGLNYMATEISKTRDETYFDFITHWNKIMKEHFWSEFRVILSRFDHFPLEMDTDSQELDSEQQEPDNALDNEIK